jgi:hypothetical protein
MIQDLLTYLLIASATAYILFSLYRLIYPSKNITGVACPGCAGNCEKKTPDKGLQPGCTSIPNQTTAKTSHPRSYSSGSVSVPVAGADRVWVPRDFASSDLANRRQ